MTVQAQSVVLRSVQTLKEILLHHQNSPFLSNLIQPQKFSHIRGDISQSELDSRSACLQAFKTSSHHQMVAPAIYNNFLKSLYPFRNTLARFSPKLSAFSQVNHDALYKSYTQLPQPGVGHMAQTDFEVFMRQMFKFRDFVRPNALSSSTISTLHDDYILKSFEEAQAARQAHIDILWRITNDLDAAKIPPSNSERRDMIWMSFYRDRPDILQKIYSIAQDGKEADKERAKNIIPEIERSSFDWNTYVEVSETFGEADIETSNTILFTAMRHQNGAAVAEILSKMDTVSFNRDTFKILLENLSFTSNLHEYAKYLHILTSERADLIDVTVLNTILASLMRLGFGNEVHGLGEIFFNCPKPHLQESEQYIKLVSTEDRTLYSAALKELDNDMEKQTVAIHPTEQTFLPVLTQLCKNAPFSEIRQLLQVAEQWDLPLTTRMFSMIFGAFPNFSLDDLTFTTAKLLEAYDHSRGFQDPWVREALQISPETSASPERSIYLNDSAYVKLSNGLTRSVFRAFQSTVDRASPLQGIIEKINQELQQNLQAASERHGTRITKDVLEPVVLNEREELAYLKRTSLVQLLEAVAEN